MAFLVPGGGLAERIRRCCLFVAEEANKKAGGRGRVTELDSSFFAAGVFHVPMSVTAATSVMWRRNKLSSRGVQLGAILYSQPTRLVANYYQVVFLKRRLLFLPVGRRAGLHNKKSGMRSTI